MTPADPEPLPPLPHAGAALFVTRVLRWNTSEIICEGRIPADGPYVRGGCCPSFVVLELAAQAAAVLDALQVGAAPGGREVEAGAPGPGSIVRVRDLILEQRTVPPGRPLRARVARAAAVPPLFTFTVRVDDDRGREILRADLGLHLPASAGRVPRAAPP